MILTTTLLALLYGLQAVSAQSFTVTSFSESTELVFPTGIADSSSETESTLPLACASGCLPVTQPYFACFVNTTQLDGSTIPSEFCDDFFCTQGNYTQLVDCANCIVANGDEKPFGYHTNTSLTIAPTGSDNVFGRPTNPLGLIGAEQANGWLRNVTERCASINRAVTGASSITAVPTTTGPYFASFQSGETISIPTWTGLTQYPPPMQTLRIPVEQVESGDGGSSSNSGNGSGSPTSSAAPSGSSAPANGAISHSKGSAGLAISGLILAFVVGA